MAPPISNPAELPEAFEQRSALTAMMSGAATTGAAGVLISAVQNSLDTHRAGALGVVTRTGGTIAFFTALGGAYSFAEAMSANVRQRNDSWNTAIGGAAAGVVVGARGECRLRARAQDYGHFHRDRPPAAGKTGASLLAAMGKGYGCRCREGSRLALKCAVALQIQSWLLPQELDGSS